MLTYKITEVAKKASRLTICSVSLAGVSGVVAVELLKRPLFEDLTQRAG